MNEPTEIKYPLDSDGEPYYAATHVQAIQGIDLNEVLENINETIEKQQKRIDLLEKKINEGSDDE